MRSLLPFALLALAPVPAAAQPTPHGVVHQRLVALLNPMGMEHALRVGFRADLGDQDALLFDGAHAEVGALSYVSPVYAVHGGYVEVSPLSFLVLEMQLSGTAMWPIGMDGAGYYPLGSYDDPVTSDALPGQDGQSAEGWEITLGATLQGAVPIGEVRLLIADSLSAQHATLGGASHYYSLRHDLVLAQQDWVLTNDAVLLVEVTLLPGTTMLLGAYDQTRYVPRSGYVGHQVGPIAALSFERPGDPVDSLDVFVRGGFYTDHVTRREEATVLGGVSVRYDLGAIR